MPLLRNTFVCFLLLFSIDRVNAFRPRLVQSVQKDASNRLARSPPTDTAKDRGVAKLFTSIISTAAILFFGDFQLPTHTFGTHTDTTNVRSTATVAPRGGFFTPAPALALTEEQEIINEAWRVVNLAFVDKTFNGLDWKAERLKYIKGTYKDKANVYAACKEMLQVLGDPYTRFLTPDEYDALAGLARGGNTENIAGIGIEITYADKKGTQPMVNSLIDGGSAQANGVKANDIIVAVDSQLVEGLSLDTVASYLRGPVDTPVRVTLQRGGGGMVDLTIKRKVVKFSPVTGKTLPFEGKRVGLITIKTFSKDTASQVLDLVKGLKGGGIDAYVIDLRHNPGGYFPGGIDTARIFLPGDLPIVSVVDKNNVGDTFTTLSGGGYDTQTRCILLVDQKTASASEIFAAAMKENSRAKLYGKTTFGKARVQTLNQLFDGSGVAVTVSKYTTPLGNDINKKGISVDIETMCEHPSEALTCLPKDALK